MDTGYKRDRLFTSLLCFGLAAAIGQITQASETEKQTLMKEAQTLAAELQSSLKSQLLSAVSTGGPVNAIDVCRVQAPEAAQKLSTNGWQLRRTALKVRNPANAPSEWERGQLEAMSAALAAGESPGALAVGEIRDNEAGRRFYYIQPIVTGAVCLGCHGSELSAEVRKALHKAYPDDQATGFAEGDLRGAFTFSKLLAAD